MKTQLLIIILLIGSTFVKAQKFEETSEFQYSDFQFTLFTPPFSTNGMEFHETINEVSLNTFLGVSAATESIELGGFMNVDLYYSRGLQASGFANVNGLLGRETYESQGIQMAGFGNVNGNRYNGVQMAGFANVNNRYKGVQMAGFANVNYKSAESVQMAGFANINFEADSSVQLAGFANFSATGSDQVQLAGFANLAEDITGVQAAGFANVARNVKGVQLAGFINVCDSIDGVPISFISYVRKNGYRSIEVSTTDWAQAQLTYRMGVAKLYNIYSVSKAYNYDDLYMLGFGFGHSISLGEKARLQLELVNHSELKYGRYYAYSSPTNNLLQFKPVFSREIVKNVFVNAGPTLNLAYTWNNRYYRNNANPYPEMVYPFWQDASGATSKFSDRLWVGFTAGISFK